MDNEESLGHTQAAMRLTKPKKTGKQKYNTEWKSKVIKDCAMKLFF